jgi:hypothetical protein
MIDQAPEFRKGHSIVLGFVVLAWILIAANVYVTMACLWFTGTASKFEH